MKRPFSLLSLIVLAFTLCITSPARANNVGEDNGQGNGGKDNGGGHGNNGGGDSGTSLPINGGIVYLIIAGVAIGITAATKKARPASAAV